MYGFEGGFTGSFTLMGIGGIGTIAGPLAYTPNLDPVGSGSSYFPGDVSDDARALNFLEELSDGAFGDLQPSQGSQAADMNGESGAWDPRFRAAIARFQTGHGLTADTWVGPKTRAALGVAVTFKNANPGVLPPPLPPVIPVDPGTVPALPAVIPGTAPEKSSTGLLVGGIVGAIGLATFGWLAFRKKRAA